MRELGIKINAVPVVNQKDFQDALKVYENSMKPQIGAKINFNVDTKQFEQSISQAMNYVRGNFDLSGSLNIDGLFDKLSEQAELQRQKVKELETAYVNLKARIQEANSVDDPLFKHNEYKSVEATFRSLQKQIKETFSPEQYKTFVDTFGKLDKEHLFGGLVNNITESKDAITGIETRMVELAGAGERVVKVVQEFGETGWENKTVRISDNVKSLNRQLQNLIMKVGNLREKAGDSQVGDQAQELLDRLQQVSVYAPDARQQITQLKEEVQNLNREFNTGKSPLEEYKKTIEDLADTQIKLASATQNDSDPQLIEKLRNEVSLLQQKSDTLRASITNVSDAQRADAAYAEAEERVRVETERLNDEFKKQHSLLYNIQSGWKEATARIFNYTVIYRAMWKLVSVMRDAIDTSKELNEAFTSIQMVTGQTAEKTRELAESYGDLAVELSSSLTDIAKGADQWIRQGESLETTTQLLRSSTIMARIGQLSDAESTEYLTSAIKGYKIAAEDAMHVVDALSEVDMKSASSVGELAEAMQRSANVAAQSGVEFERLVGYLATMKDVSQRAAPVIGEAMKTILSRIGSVAAGKFLEQDLENEYEDFETYVNDIEKVLSGVGLRLRDTNHEFRNAQDILDDVAKSWSKFNDLEKNAISTAFGGTRQRELFLVLMQNYEKALELTQAAYDSAGTSAQKYAVYQESIAAQQNRINALWQQFVLNADFASVYSDLLSIAEMFMKVLAEVGKFSKAIPAVLTAITALNFALKSFGGGSILNLLSDPVNTFKNLASGITMAAQSSTSLSGAFKTLITANPAASISLAVSAALLLWQVFKKLFPTVEELKSKLSGLRSEVEESKSQYDIYSEKLDEIRSKIEELNRLKVNGTITAIQKDELENLKLESKEIEYQLILERERLELLKEQQRVAALKVYNQPDLQGFVSETVHRWFSTDADNYEGYLPSTKMVLPLDQRLNAYTEQILELEEKLKETEDSNEIKEIASLLSDYRGRAIEAAETLELVADSLDKDSSEYELVFAALENYYNSRMSLDEKIEKVMGKEEFEPAIQKLKELGQQGKLTADELNSVEFSGLISALNELDAFEAPKIEFDSEEQKQELKEVLDSYREELEEAKRLGVDLTKTVYGNIDTDNRQILEWTKESTELFKAELESWGEAAEEMIGSVSTILGTSMEFDGVEMAFSPILQDKDNGPTLLSKSTMVKYITSIMEAAGDTWTKEDLLRLDSEGIVQDGILIKNMLADVGETARKTGEAMHFTGKTGGISSEFKTLQEFADRANVSVEQLIYILDHIGVEGLEDAGGVVEYLIEKFNDATEAAEEFANELKEISQVDMTSQLEPSVSVLGEALAQLTKEGYLSHEMVIKLKEANYDLGKSLTLTKDGYKVTKAELLSLIDAQRKEYTTTVSQSLQAAAKLVGAKVDEKQAYDQVTAAIIKKIDAQMKEAEASWKASMAELKGIGYGEGVWEQRNAINAQIKAATARYDALKDAKKDLETSIKNLDTFDTSVQYLLNQATKSSSSGSSYDKKTQEEKETAFEREIRILEHRQYLAEQWANTYEKDATKQIEYQQKINEQIEIYNQLMAKTHAEANRLRSLGFTDESEEIQNLQRRHWQYYNARNELMQKEVEEEKEVENAYERQIRLLEHKQFLAEQWANLYKGNSNKEAEYQEKINEQIEIYGELMEAVNEEARRLRGQGFDNESAEIQELQRKYWDYYNYRRDLIDRLYDFQKEKLEEQKRLEEEALQKTESALSELRSAINDLIDEARERLDKIVDNLDYQISKLQAMRDLTKQYHTSINEIAKLQNDINKELAKSKSQYAYIDKTLRDTLFNDKDYKKLSQKLESIANESEKLYKEYLQELSTLTEDEIYKADMITNEYRRQYELKKMEYNIAQAELNLVKAQANLQEVLANRNVRMFQNGQWTWVADHEAVKNAQEAVEDAKYNYKQAQIEKRQQEIINQYDKMIAALEAQKQQQQAEFNVLKDRWNEVQKQLTTQGDAMSRIIKIITETDLPEFRRIVGNVGGALTDIINDANAFGGGMDRVIDNIVDMIGTAANRIDDILDDLERDYGSFDWDDSGVSGGGSGQSGNVSGSSGNGYGDLYSDNYLKSAILAARDGDLDLAYAYLDKRAEKVASQGGNDRGISASQAYSMVMQEYTAPGSYTFDSKGNAIYVGGNSGGSNSSSNSSRPSSSGSNSSSGSSSGSNSGSSSSSSGSGSKLVWASGTLSYDRKPGFSNMTIIQRTSSGDYEVSYDRDGNVLSAKPVYDKGGVLEGMGGIKATPKDEAVFDSKISSMLLSPRRSQEFLNSADALTKIMENVGGFNKLMTALEAVVNSSSSVNDSHDFVFNGNVVGEMDRDDFSTVSSILRRYIPIMKG